MPVGTDSKGRTWGPGEDGSPFEELCDSEACDLSGKKDMVMFMDGDFRKLLHW